MRQWRAANNAGGANVIYCSGSSPDFSRDVVVERHILAVVGAAPLPSLPLPEWSVWVGRTVISRTDSREEALAEGRRLAPPLKCDLWFCEDGKNYELLGRYGSELPFEAQQGLRADPPSGGQMPRNA
jgi:hypothetical protein